MKSLCKLFVFLCIFLFTGKAYSDGLDDTLKQDFSKQETIKIRYEVNRRLFSYEAGKFKLENINKNKDKIRAITNKIAPWAIMEHMTPPEVARIIVYMYHADQAGAAFTDSEDLIPLISKQDIPLKDFVLMVQYNKETKEAGIPIEIRDAFLGITYSAGWDGVSILAGGRGLILAKASKLNINKTASLLVKKLPSKGAAAKEGELAAVIGNIIGESVREREASEIVNNIANTQKSVKGTENSPDGLKTILSNSSKSDEAVRQIGKIEIPPQTVKNEMIDKEPEIVSETTLPVAVNENWQILSRNALLETIKPWIGTPYKYGCRTGHPGIDCSGFTRAVLTNKRIGVPSQLISYSSADQSKCGSPVTRRDVRAGDLVFFSASPDQSKITHVGLATSNGTFTHASLKGVVNDDLDKKWWTQRFIKSRRLFAKVTD